MRHAKALFFAIVLFAPAAQAQQYFGKNQVQYDKFDWRILETEHFLVHYYPEEYRAAVTGARMAERAYGRLSRIFDHQFREKKPMVFYASRSDFGQNTVTGDLGEFVGGVTEALRHRILLPFTGDFESFERVLTHEMVHEFQYDIFARGKAGAGLQALQQVQPPGWLMEGMAAYLEYGPNAPNTDTFLRDAALNGRLPTIEQMTMRPDRFNPYVYGEALWAYIGERWGDDMIGRLMSSVTSMGVERAFKREMGMSLEELSDEWKDALQLRHLPGVPQLDRARKFAQPLLTERRTSGQIFLAPALSGDGSMIAFLSHGSLLRGEIFIDLWLGDARTGKRIHRLVKSTTDPNFEELRLLYSQSAFSPDGKRLAFTAQRKGKDVLYLLDVKRRRTVERFDLPLEGVTGPTWAPDGQRLVFSGNAGGITDLYMIDADGKNFRRLTNDAYGEVQPNWSPDGRRIAYATDRGADSSLELLRFSRWRIAVLDLETGRSELLPDQGGLNLNPQWAPDGQSVAFVSDRTGVQNIFLYDFTTDEHFQLTNVIGGVMAGTEYSPVISWAREADKLAFTYFEDNEFTVWTIDDPRRLKDAPFHEPTRPAPLVATIDEGRDSVRSPAVADSGRSPFSMSFYRSDVGLRASADLPTASERRAQEIVSVVALLDSAALALPDTSKFKDYNYKVRFQPDYIARPSIGYVDGGYNSGVLGGTAIILSDMLGGHRLAFAGEVNGRFSDARLFASYTSLANRFQYSAGLFQTPYYFLSNDGFLPLGEGLFLQYQDITRYVIRQVFGVSQYPFSRFTRVEFGGRFTNIDRTTYHFSRGIDNGLAFPFYLDSINHQPGINYVSPYVAYVSDNTIFGFTGPIFGRRYRFQLEQTLGSLQWMEYLVDYRRYDPIIFNFLTVATRLLTSVAVGRDEETFPKYIGRPEFVRGYDRRSSFSGNCGVFGGSPTTCSATQLLGSRIALANAELRFPLIRRFELGLLPVALPPLDGLVFYDIGMAWSGGQEVFTSRPEDYDQSTMRYPLRSYGFGLRLNLFNYAILRWDYAVPIDSPDRDGFWTWTIGPSF